MRNLEDLILGGLHGKHAVRRGTVYCENRTQHTDTVCTSQETHYFSTTETNRLMLLGETVAVCCENRTQHSDTIFKHVECTVHCV
jgi:hypothetical protein